ncbi:hypothetical protein KFZ56_12830 [Virgibacillus sp. NKC19-3]|uniref:hypothetical protein n=1 Tax=Virgibacillus saliphilus TaxID=2831674 RepID=UPI001C9A5B85|nr:hypothetical protein [Virgibacillus sp. NKC19-3]MBY7143917.1 hypothetical protein [Virgibacillus sp. NKC19-3]
MQMNGMWLPLVASVGMGAATYYAMTKNNQNFGQAMQKMIPVVAQMNGNQSGRGSNPQQLDMS